MRDQHTTMEVYQTVIRQINIRYNLQSNLDVHMKRHDGPVIEVANRSTKRQFPVDGAEQGVIASSHQVSISYFAARSFVK